METHQKRIKTVAGTEQVRDRVRERSTKLTDIQNLPDVLQPAAAVVKPQKATKTAAVAGTGSFVAIECLAHYQCWGLVH